MAGRELFAELVKVGDDLSSALAVHRAVVVALHDRVDLRAPFEDRVRKAIFEIELAVARLGRSGHSADLHRHLAALYEYDGQTYGARLSADGGLDQAIESYRELQDRYGLCSTYFLRGSLRRRFGMAGAQDDLVAASETYGSGFDFAAGIIAAEQALVAMTQRTGIDPIPDLERTRSALVAAGLPRETSYVSAALGLVAVERGDFDWAAKEFERVREAGEDVRRSESARRTAAHGSEVDGLRSYGHSAQLELTLDTITNEFRLARIYQSLGHGEQAFEAAQRSVRAVQLVPAGWWYVPDRTQDPFHATFQGVYQLAIVLAGEAGASSSSALGCLSVIEAARRSNLAAWIRYGATHQDAFSASHRDAIRDGILEERATLERLVPWRAPDDENSQVAPDIFGQFEGGLGAWLAEACFPETISPEAISSALRTAEARRADLLVVFETFRDERELRGVAIAVPSGESPMMKSFVLQRDLVEFLGLLRKERTNENFSAVEHGINDESQWRRLGEALLPIGFADQLLQRVVSGQPPGTLLVSPTGALAYLPWAAVVVKSDPVSVRLVETSDIAVLPSLTLLDEQHRPFPSCEYTPAITKDFGKNESESIRNAWQQCDVSIQDGIDSVDALKNVVDRERCLFLVSHGSETHSGGLDQCILLDRESRAPGASVTAWDAFDLPWPPGVIFVSCNVSRTRLEPGIEPFSLSLAILGSGAKEFIAATTTVFVDVTALHQTLVQELHAGASPLRALGVAQRRALRSGEDPRIESWATLQTTIAG